MENERVIWDHLLAYRRSDCGSHGGNRCLFGVTLLLLYYVAVSHLSATFVLLYLTYYTPVHHLHTYSQTLVPVRPSPLVWLNSGVLICNLFICLIW